MLMTRKCRNETTTKASGTADPDETRRDEGKDLKSTLPYDDGYAFKCYQQFQGHLQV